MHWHDWLGMPERFLGCQRIIKGPGQIERLELFQ